MPTRNGLLPQWLLTRPWQRGGREAAPGNADSGRQQGFGVYGLELNVGT